MADPQVSVVVPVRNRRELLRRCLDALDQQDMVGAEILVVDDGSSDGSAEEARRDARAGRPVRLVANRGSGAVAARATGAAEARAPVLAFTDSDCRPAPGWLRAGLAAVAAGADVVQGSTRPAGPVRPGERSLWSDFEDGLYATCNVFYRRAAFDAAGGFDVGAGPRLGFRPDPTSRDLGLGEDTLLGWRVRRAGRAVFAPDAVVEHHVFTRDGREALRRAWSTGAFPGLVAEVPELRRTLLVDGRYLGRRSRVPLYAAAVAALLGRRGAAAALAAVWVRSRWRHVRAGETDRRCALRALPLDLAVDATIGAALVTGSARSRTLVL